MENITIVLFDEQDEIIVRQKMTIKKDYMDTRKLINDHLLYLINFYSEDSDITKIEILRDNK